MIDFTKLLIPLCIYYQHINFGQIFVTTNYYKCIRIFGILIYKKQISRHEYYRAID